MNLKELRSYKAFVPHHNGIKLEINNRKITGKSPNIWKVNNIVLVIHESQQKSKESRNYFDLNIIVNTKTCGMCLRGKLEALNAYVKKELSQMRGLKKLEKGQIKYKASRRKEIIQSRNR